MISEVDAHIGRIRAALEARGEWDNTLIIITADHGEQLGDQGLQQKCGWFESSYHILGIVRDPSSPQGHGRVVTEFTENVDIMPTLCAAIGVPVPVQCDGVPLTPFLRGEQPEHWRTAAHYEWDWRDVFIMMDSAASTPGRGSAASSGATWPWCAPTPTPTCSSATATGSASTSPPTPPGRSPPPTLRVVLPLAQQMARVASNSTSIARSRAC